MSFFYCIPFGQIWAALKLTEALPLILGDLQFIAMYGLVHEFRLQNTRFSAFFFFFFNYKGNKEKIGKLTPHKAAINLKFFAGVHMLQTTSCKSFIGS